MRISELETLHKKMKDAIKDKNTPEKYRKNAEKDFLQLQKDLDIIYKKYSELAVYEDIVCRKWGL